MAQPLIREEQEEDVIDLYKRGLSQQAIGDRYGVSREAVKRVLKKHGMSRKDKPKRFSDEEMNKIIQMYESGMSTREIGELYSVSDTTIQSWLEKNNIKRRSSIYTLNDNYFDEIDNQDKAYILGLLYADGCNKASEHTVSITLQEEDRHILEDINILIQNTRPLYFVNLKQYNNSWKNGYELDIRGKHISEMLCKYGVVPKKSLILKYPYWMEQDLQRHFIRGYFDGDGHISKAKYKYNMSIVSTKDFCEGVQQIIETQLGLPTHLYISSTIDKPTRTLMLTRKNDCKVFFDWLYKDANLFLKRKYNIYLEKYCNNDLNINNNLIKVAN